MPEHSCSECEWLLAKTTTIPEVACIIVIDTSWSRPVNGYARITGGNAHRWFYQHVTGLKLSSKIDVRHACDIRPCINFDHLGHGDRFRNMQDAVERNRTVAGDAHHWSKINSNLARQVIDAYQAGRDGKPGLRLTQDQVGALFGVDQSTISRIWHGRTWFRDTATDGIRRDVSDAGRILTPADVRFIRSNHPRLSKDELSAMFGTHRDNVKKILSGQYWADVD